MKKHMIKNSLALVVSAAVLAGCSNMDTQDVPDESAQGQQSQQQNGGQTFGSQNDSGVTSTALQDAEAAKKAEQERIARELEAKAREQAVLREVRTFYFDFDKSDIKQEALMSLNAHAAFLAANTSVKVVLEGHADERGTKEYNMALGERRAKSVERFLIVNGVAPAQVEIVSFGEEKPVEMGSNEVSWAKNRRVFINYQ